MSEANSEVLTPSERHHGEETEEGRWSMGEKLPRSGLVVRLQWRLISTVQVRVGVCHTSVAEGHCVTARWGGEQPEANPRSVG